MKLKIIMNEKKLRDFIADHYKEGSHGLSHWQAVENYGRLIAQSRKEVDEDVVRWFAYLHDVQRLSDFDDIDHGQRAAQYIDVLRNSYLSDLSDSQIQLLKKACALHTITHSTTDITINCCFDADRLDLMRFGIVTEKSKMADPYNLQVVAGFFQMSNEEKLLFDNELFWLQHTHNHALYSASLGVLRRNLNNTNGIVVQSCIEAYEKTLPKIYRDNDAIKSRCFELLSLDQNDKAEVILSAIKKLHKEKWEFFVDICQHFTIPGKELAQALRYTWINSNLPEKYHKFAQNLFNMIRQEDIMTDIEYRYLKQLPQMVTLYRGCSDDEPEHNDNFYHPSWSQNYQVACNYAFLLGEKYYDKERRCIVKAIVPRKQISCVFNNGAEEFVVFGVKRSDAEIIKTYSSFSDG